MNHEFPYVTTADLADQGLEPNRKMKALMKAGTEYTELRNAVVEAARLWRKDWLLNAGQMRQAIDNLLDFERFGRDEILSESENVGGSR